MSTEPKTPEELAAEAFPVRMREFGIKQGDAHALDRSKCVVAIRKQAEQCRLYMQHLAKCEKAITYRATDNICTCGLEAVLNAMK